jgi:hypothetical protein
VIREEDDVASTLAQRRQPDRENGEPMVQILAEPALANRRRQIAVRRADDPDVDGLAVRAAETADRALLDGFQELGLETFGQQADLVEKDRAAMGGLEEAGLCVARVREGPALESKQLGLEERFRNRRAVDVDEGLTGARATSVDEPGEQSLSRARLPGEQDGGHPTPAMLTSQQSPNGLPDGLDRQAFAQQLVHRFHHRARRMRTVAATEWHFTRS